MKNTIRSIAVFLILFLTYSFQSHSQQKNIPKKGILEINAKSEIHFWKNIEHNAFRIHLSNPSKVNSCEAYIVKNGREKWISPSLLANGTLEFNVPKNSSIFFKNFSTENLKITYTIN
jgi:hypothetical protein